MPASIGKCVSLTALMTCSPPSPQQEQIILRFICRKRPQPKRRQPRALPPPQADRPPGRMPLSQAPRAQAARPHLRRRACVKNEAVDSASTSSSHVKASLEASTCTASGDTQTELITIGPNEEATPLYNDSEPVSQAANAISQLNRSWIIPVIAATFLLLAGGMIWLLIRRKSSK